MRAGSGVEFREDRFDLQSDQHEGEHVEKEDHGLPDREGRQAETRGRARGARGRGGEGDQRQHARQMQALGDQPDAEGRQELHEDRRRRIRDARRDARQQYAERPAGKKRGWHGKHEQRDCRRRHGEGRRDHRAAKDHQRARVVEQALALENGDEAARRIDVAQDGGGGDRVGRRDNGAERDRRGPGEIGRQPARDNGDGNGCGDDGAEHKAGNRDPVALQIADRHVEAGVDQHRRKKKREREIGLEFDARRARHESDARADEREKGRIGRADPARQGGQRQRDGKNQQDGFEQRQGAAPTRGGRRARPSLQIGAAAPASNLRECKWPPVQIRMAARATNARPGLYAAFIRRKHGWSPI